MDEGTAEVGRHTREQVLGAEYVSTAWRKSDDEFWQDFQSYVQTTAWGQIWSRPGLALRDRSLVVLTGLATLHREREVRIHLRAAINNGLTLDELREVALQMAPYCGLPTTEFLLAQMEAIDLR